MLKPSIGRSPSVKSLYSPKDRQDQRGFRIRLEDSAGLLGDAGGKVHRHTGTLFYCRKKVMHIRWILSPGVSLRIIHFLDLLRLYLPSSEEQQLALVTTVCVCFLHAQRLKLWHDFDVRAAYLEILAAVFSFQLAYFAEPWRCLSVWLCSSTLANIQLPCCQQLSKLKAHACMITSF